jgi:hypothetical protein
MRTLELEPADRVWLLHNELTKDPLEAMSAEELERAQLTREIGDAMKMDTRRQVRSARYGPSSRLRDRPRALRLPPTKCLPCEWDQPRGMESGCRRC